MVTVVTLYAYVGNGYYFVDAAYKLWSYERWYFCCELFDSMVTVLGNHIDIWIYDLKTILTCGIDNTLFYDDVEDLEMIIIILCEQYYMDI